jgi:hypothetical protein
MKNDDQSDVQEDHVDLADFFKESLGMELLW